MIHSAARRIIRKWAQYRLSQVQFGSVGHNVRINYRNVRIGGSENIHLGSNISFGEGLTIAGEGGVRIGDNTAVAPFVTIWSANHVYEAGDDTMLPFNSDYTYKPVVIHENVWVGYGAVILPGVTIGEGAIIGAGSVVSKDVPACAIAAGNPARVVKSRSLEAYEAARANKRYVTMMGEHWIQPKLNQG